MDGSRFFGAALTMSSASSPTPHDLVIRKRAELCRLGAKSPSLFALWGLAQSNDEVVRVSMLDNEAFAALAPGHAYTMLTDATATWVTRQAVAVSRFVGPVLHREVFERRELYVLLAFVNNRTVPRDIWEVIVKERAFEAYTDLAGDINRPPHLHHAHLLPVYKMIFGVALQRVKETG